MLTVELESSLHVYLPVVLLDEGPLQLDVGRLRCLGGAAPVGEGRPARGAGGAGAGRRRCDTGQGVNATHADGARRQQVQQGARQAGVGRQVHQEGAGLLAQLLAIQGERHAAAPQQGQLGVLAALRLAQPLRPRPG